MAFQKQPACKHVPTVHVRLINLLALRRLTIKDLLDYLYAIEPVRFCPCSIESKDFDLLIVRGIVDI